MSSKSLRYHGCSLFRNRLTTSILSGKTLIIKDIRSDHEAPGLLDYEASYLRLLDKLLDGSFIEINETGTLLKFRPGILIGGSIQHDCPSSRSIGWFIEGIIPLIVFAKNPVSIQFTGITNDEMDISVDVFKSVTLPLMRNFGIEGMTLNIKRRGAAPNGGGLVEFTCPIVRELKPLNVTDAGLIKRIRGIAFCAKISPTILTRVVDSARAVLNEYIPDVYIHTDHYRGADSGASAGYSLALFAESTTGVLLSSECTASPGGRQLPEDIGRHGALQLLEEIWKGGVIDSAHQSLVLLLMTMSPEDVCKVRFGSSLTDQSVETLRLLKDAFGVVFKIKEDPETHTLQLSCLGIGYKNMSRKAT
mmetsp:Transcript_12155/g.18355  ORF Transcript_12155/g.18355 Transcript_12155/m.18355 type:complete len:362 (+) Transcript_12155:64-1149(+)